MSCAGSGGERIEGFIIEWSKRKIKSLFDSSCIKDLNVAPDLEISFS